MIGIRCGFLPNKTLGFHALSVCALAAWLATASLAAVTSTTQHGATVEAFDSLISSTDLIHGRGTLDVDVYENPMDTFGNPSIGVNSWHPVNTNPLDLHPAFTDGQGMRSTNFTGLLNDNFPVESASGRPAKIVEYPFSAPVDIGQINILTGNRNNADGRIFSTTYIEYSTNNGFTYQPIGYFQSDPSGTINSEVNPQPPLSPPQKSTLVRVFDNSSPTLASGVTNLIFNFYSVDNTGGQMRDPFNGVNPFTGFDDTLSAAFVSPMVLEIDVFAPSAGLTGDYNGDGTVDAADYIIWRKNGINGQQGYDDWRANFGSTLVVGSISGGAVGVPEPTGVAMLAVILYVACSRLRRAFV